MEIVRIRLSDIKPYEGNAKEHPDTQVEQIAESIREFGNNDPIAVDEENVIIEGHGRYMALRKLGYEEAECIVLKGMTEDQKSAYRLVHNQLTMNSGFDPEIIRRELERIEMDMKAFDLDAADFPEPIPQLDEDDVPDERADHGIKRGDIFQLGGHRVMCGDSTSRKDVDRLVNGERCDCLLTDPPYNVGIENAAGKTIDNDSMDSAAFGEFLRKCFGNAVPHVRPGGGILCVARSEGPRPVPLGSGAERPAIQAGDNLGEELDHAQPDGLPVEA